MKNLVLLITTCFTLSACGTPAIVAFPSVIGAGLAINNEKLEEPLEQPKEMADAILVGVTEGYSKETFTSHKLNK